MGLNKLKTSTILGDKVIKADEILAEMYPANQQRDGKKPPSPNSGKPLFRNRADKPEFEMSPEMERAINEDLATKGLPAKPKRTRKTTTKTTDTK